MRSVSAGELNQLHAAFKSDSSSNADQFWSALDEYASWSLFSTPGFLRDDLHQDVMLVVLEKIDSLAPEKSFSKWLNGVVNNLRADRFREEKYDAAETPFSQLAIDNGDGTYDEFEPSTALDVTDPSDPEDPLKSAQAATRKLNQLRDGFKKQADRDLLDALRSGMSLAEAAGALGRTYGSVQRRFARWREKKVAPKLSDVLKFPDVTYRENKLAA